jgi:hypothetical protein
MSYSEDQMAESPFNLPKKELTGIDFLQWFIEH